MTTVSPTLLTPYGYSSGTCGYCSPSGERSRGKTSSKYGMITEQMTPDFYQLLIDRGWRRSGDYIYHPDMARTCCPQYTIRLNVNDFKGNKKHRQVINRFNRYLETGQKPGESSTITDVNMDKQKSKRKREGKGKGKSNVSQKNDLIDDLHTFEVRCIDKGEEDRLAHKFETRLVPAKATTETFELYKSYQVAVHKDKPDKVTMRGFDRFLCGNTLVKTPIKYSENVENEIQNGKLPKDYGQYHLLYKVDSRVIGISVIDILPSCVSSVYFIWHPDWAWASLGKLSALYEISLARRMKAKGVEGMKWVYMGYWIPDCQKMKYKSEYSPSELLDPEKNIFHSLDTKLESFLISHPTGYFPFNQIESSQPHLDDSATIDESRNKQQDKKTDSASDMIDSDEESEEEAPSNWPNPTPPGFEEPSEISNEKLGNVLLLMGRNKFTGKGGKLVPIDMLEFRNQDSMYQEIKEFIAAVGSNNIAQLDSSNSTSIAGKAILFLG
ncbi:uncharacterized protein L201_001758 [Kwoniella dendrophila CBS 6074]|uniref:arginyltransferase n=1 Tax=Kwoniella dendrophila CBS 6074 TaxID=1295534 RepID=A0AAX4JND3_9TREE